MIIYGYDHAGKAIGLRNHSLVYAEGQARKLELVVDAYERIGFREDYRNYEDVVEILKHFGLLKIRLLTNSPRRIKALEKNGIKIGRVPLEQNLEENPYVAEEYRAKVTKLGHFLSLNKG